MVSCPTRFRVLFSTVSVMNFYSMTRDVVSVLYTWSYLRKALASIGLLWDLLNTLGCRRCCLNGSSQHIVSQVKVQYISCTCIKMEQGGIRIKICDDESDEWRMRGGVELHRSNILLFQAWRRVFRVDGADRAFLISGSAGVLDGYVTQEDRDLSEVSAKLYW